MPQFESSLNYRNYNCDCYDFFVREELIEAFNECFHNNEEGLVLKKCDMKYKPNARDGSDGYKIKAEVRRRHTRYIYVYI